jgi:succinyl-diaminopimelate desuccinylase
MQFVANLTEKYYGEVFGIENNDAVFGKLTCTNGMAYMNNGRLNLTFDMRYGMSVDIEKAKQNITELFNKNDWSVEFVKSRKPFYLSKEDKYLNACLQVYKDFTKSETAETYINAGGTYAGQLPRAIEIGTALYNDRKFDLPGGHGGAHQPDEYINIDGMLKAIELTALMLLECDGVEICE